MTDGRFNSGQKGEAVPAPEDQALLADLLPGLDDRVGPARRRPQAILEAMVHAVLDAVLVAQDAVTRQPTEDVSAAGPAGGWLCQLGSHSGPLALVLVAASLALFSAGALTAAVIVRVALPQAPAPAPVRTTRALPAAPMVDAPVVDEESEAMTEPEPEVVQPPTVARVRPPRFPASDAAVVAQIVSAAIHVEKLRDAVVVALETPHRAVDSTFGEVEESGRRGEVRRTAHAGEGPAQEPEEGAWLGGKGARESPGRQWRAACHL